MGCNQAQQNVIGTLIVIVWPPYVLSVRLSRTARNSKTRKRRKIRIDINIPQDTSKWLWSANFQFEGTKVKVTGRKKPPKIFTYGRQRRRIKRGRRWLHTRPTPLLGLLYCRGLRPWATGLHTMYSLPCGLRTLDISYKHFKTLLKTYMFD